MATLYPPAAEPPRNGRAEGGSREPVSHRESAQSRTEKGFVAGVERKQILRVPQNAQPHVYHF